MTSLIKKTRNSFITAVLRSAFSSQRLLVLLADCQNWQGGKITPESMFPFILQKFIDFPEFRSLLYYRADRGTVFLRLLKIIFPPQSALFICCPDIGPGLYLEHAFATIISARAIGANAHINQMVTIGHTAKGSPLIGNNVTIYAGASVIGDITLGDNVVVGAGAVVLKSVPPDCIVAGIPAKIISTKPPVSAEAPL
ncbi:hypothetical protein [Prosthecobacter sp.]|uniref:hypothetical protein n=1 Tax=Prosthecobacter sp. TaxID=1965333 RepID=UPI002AB874C7|nr:hypothetical protein [Prosthecobacter sp.]MDZ4403909.1 hypothetical protein [Prosthecobacter sp.]